jgi:GNAT superfamily N-acetyltransferase
MPPATSPAIRELRSGDLDEALALSTAAGWNQQIDDWRMLHTLAAPHAFAAVARTRIVGTALAIDYGPFAWIAMMLVAPAFRGRGIGARLLEAALDAVPSGRPVRLDATPAGRALYQRYDFEDEARLTRLVLPHGRPRAADDAGATRLTTGADVPALCTEDAGVFGADRSRVLVWALQRAPHYARVIESAAGPPQYVFGRHGRVFDQIGPVAAGGEPAARALVTAALAATGTRSVAIDAVDRETGFTAWLRASGFVDKRPLFRMCRPAAAPPREARERPPRQFAIFGPDFG